MNINRAEEIKAELNDCLNSQDYGCLSEESIMDMLSLLDKMYPKNDIKQDTTPMIGTNPFKGSTKRKDDVTPDVKDFNKSLNYRVNRFKDLED